MDSIDYEFQYNSRKAIPGHEAISARWDELAAQYRAENPGEPDIAYGESEREKYDFFPAPGAGQDTPVCAYIHGGYWKSRDRKTFSHVARGLNARGVSVAIPSYNHCPHVGVADIISEMRSFLAALWQKTGQHPAVAGHSAGGHLTGCMLATDWSAIEGVPDDLVRRAFAISGIYDLTPICKVSVNEELNLTEDTARAVSPLFWERPPANRAFIAAVGGLESAEFRRQSRTIADAWSAAGLKTDYAEIPDCNHFTVVNAVAEPDSPWITRIADFAIACAKG